MGQTSLGGKNTSCLPTTHLNYNSNIWLIFFYPMPCFIGIKDINWEIEGFKYLKIVYLIKTVI